jgi:hypothetical protein
LTQGLAEREQTLIEKFQLSKVLAEPEPLHPQFSFTTARRSRPAPGDE